MSTAIKTREKVSIAKTEYIRLKRLDRHFRGFFAYLENMADIRDARKEVKQKKMISQEKLFEQLGL